MSMKRKRQREIQKINLLEGDIRTMENLLSDTAKLQGFNSKRRDKGLCSKLELYSKRLFVLLSDRNAAMNSDETDERLNFRINSILDKAHDITKKKKTDLRFKKALDRKE